MADPATLGAPDTPLEGRVIDVHVASKRFGDLDVLRDVRFTVARGETLAIIGPSGIGKTTLLRLVAGIDRDFEGEITRPGAIGIVFQEPTLLPWRSALKNLTLVHQGLGAEAARAALARVGLAGKEEMFPGQLSLGQQRRLALARAIAGRPDLLILDEPFVSLDAKIADEMLTLTEELIREVQPATLFVTHSKPEAERLATRIFRLGA